MQTILRTLTILSVAVLLALGMYFAAQNESVRAWLGVAGSSEQSFGADMQRNGSDVNAMPRPTFDGNMPPGGAQGERGEHGGATTLTRNLALFGGMILSVALVQQSVSRFRRQRKTKLA